MSNEQSQPTDPAEWDLIWSAPASGPVWVRRIRDGEVIAEGWAVYGHIHDNAPMRSSLGPDPLGRLIAIDGTVEDETREAFVSQKHWLTLDRMYCFPAPTHWLKGRVYEKDVMGNE